MEKYRDFNENEWLKEYFKNVTKEEIVKAIVNKHKDLIADYNKLIETKLDKIIIEEKMKTLLDIAYDAQFLAETKLINI